MIKREGYIGAAAVAERLDVSIGTVYNWARIGRLPASRSGSRRWLFSVKDVDRLQKELEPRPYMPLEDVGELVEVVR